MIAMTASAMDNPFSRTSNLAGSPLPLIPRRASASRLPLPAFASSSTSTFSASPPLTASPVRITVQRATPPESDAKLAPIDPDNFSSSSSDSSSTSSGSSSRSKALLRPKRVLGVPRSQSLTSTEPPSPTLSLSRAMKKDSRRAASPPAVVESPAEMSEPDTPRVLRAPAPGRLYFESSSKQRHFSESHIPDTPAPSVSTLKSAPPNETPSMIRKKSGQILKSSLKGSRSAPRPGLQVITAMMASKSEPNTPTLKAVHFDAKLEHVKLFLAEQKPLAVSRDGSPTDTSGTDSDFPSFIFGDSDRTPKQRLVMNVINMPSTISRIADVAMESLLLSDDGTTVLGRVRVRNLAFQKWLAVRFTFDSWQTTSEVTAKWAETIDADFDIFAFSVKLNDLLARIEDKTLVLALRYSVLGREIWDNNNGRNYVAKFSRVKPAAGRAKASGSRASASDSGSDISDLKAQLEKVVQKRDEAEFVTLPPLRASRSTSSVPPISTPDLTSRYDLGSSLKFSRKSPPTTTTTTTTTTVSRARTSTYPSVNTPLASPPSSIPFPAKVPSPPVTIRSRVIGSPRDLDADTFHPAPYVASDPDTRPFAVRNHQRGYFDLSFQAATTVKRTPPGTPRMRSADDSTPIPRAYSFPPVDIPLFGLAYARDVEGAASDESTPSIISPGSSSDQDSSPAHSPTDGAFLERLGDKKPDTNYHQFINRYCFYTGGENVEAPVVLSRSSSLDDVLLASPQLPSFVVKRLSESLTPTQHTASVDHSTPTPANFRSHPAVAL